MTKEEVLKLALEALELSHPRFGIGTAIYIKAMNAIKEALAQPEPNYKKALEVWLDKTEWVQKTVKPHELGMHRADVLKQRIEEALAQPEQEPVAWRYKILDYFGRPVWTFKTPKTDIRVFESQPLYTSPPQRTWVGLTLDERIELAQDVDWAVGAYCEYAEKIESKLKEKNI